VGWSSDMAMTTTRRLATLHQLCNFMGGHDYDFCPKSYGRDECWCWLLHARVLPPGVFERLANTRHNDW